MLENKKNWVWQRERERKDIERNRRLKESLDRIEKEIERRSNNIERRLNLGIKRLDIVEEGLKNNRRWSDIELEIRYEEFDYKMINIRDKIDNQIRELRESRDSAPLMEEAVKRKLLKDRIKNTEKKKI